MNFYVTEMTLSELPDGGLMLKFPPEDVPRVRARIEGLFGSFVTEPYIDGQRLIIDGVRMLYLNDWDQPAIIAVPGPASEMLRLIASADTVAALAAE